MHGWAANDWETGGCEGMCCRARHCGAASLEPYRLLTRHPPLFPTAQLKLIFKVNWLSCPDGGRFYWGVIPCLGGDWLLAFVRLSPFIIVVMLDTSLFYQASCRPTTQPSRAARAAPQLVSKACWRPSNDAGSSEQPR
jgi:hypothetical protein